jgi:hypothetical protein
LQDLRRQLNVGADAIDRSGRFYELKVHGGAAPDTISLTASEVERARDPRFFLVVVSGVEAGTTDPEVRFISNPLYHLIPVGDGSISLRGVRRVEALVYTLRSDPAT